jgi:hypothetical protein
MSVTVTYKAPYTTAPTKVQQHYHPKSLVIATVAAGASSDALAIITHDFGLSAAELALDYPVVTITPLDGDDITSPWFEVSQNPNYTVLGKGTVAQGGAVKVAISRPPTSIR